MVSQPVCPTRSAFPEEGPTVFPARRLSAIIAIAAALLAPRAAKVRADDEAPKPLRVGIIGLDTSHVTAFTKVLNGPKSEGAMAGIRVVAAYPGGSPDIPS